MSQSKVFGIGLARTGTTSLYEALRILGYSAIDFPLGLRGVEEHDAATDIPIADSFELLDRKYPGSKFIYTVRQRDHWVRSCKTHWVRFIDSGRESRPEAAELVKRLYGTNDFDEEMFRNAYKVHEKRVLSYFSCRQSDLLIIDICSGKTGWEPLCLFLGKEIPDCPFPFVNKTKNVFEHHLEKNKLGKKALKKTRKMLRVLTHRR